jgi:hypothetical protein
MATFRATWTECGDTGGFLNRKTEKKVFTGLIVGSFSLSGRPFFIVLLDGERGRGETRWCDLIVDLPRVTREDEGDQ